MHLWVYIVESFFFMVKILMVHGDVISWVTGLLQCKTIISILFNFCGDIHLWVGVTQKLNKHWSPTNNEDSSVHLILGSSQWITSRLQCRYNTIKWHYAKHLYSFIIPMLIISVLYVFLSWLFVSGWLVCVW